MKPDKGKETCKEMAQQIKNALTRRIYHDEEEKLKDAQAYIWISIGIICLSLIIFLARIVRCL